MLLKLRAPTTSADLSFSVWLPPPLLPSSPSYSYSSLPVSPFFTSFYLSFFFTSIFISSVLCRSQSSYADFPLPPISLSYSSFLVLLFSASSSRFLSISILISSFQLRHRSSRAISLLILLLVLFLLQFLSYTLPPLDFLFILFKIFLVIFLHPFLSFP